MAAEDEHESTPTDAIVSEPLQIIVATQDEVVVEEESTVDPVEEEHTSETIGE